MFGADPYVALLHADGARQRKAQTCFGLHQLLISGVPSLQRLRCSPARLEVFRNSIGNLCGSACSWFAGKCSGSHSTSLCKDPRALPRLSLPPGSVCCSHPTVVSISSLNAHLGIVVLNGYHLHR